jgi:hypothetical protein
MGMFNKMKTVASSVGNTVGDAAFAASGAVVTSGKENAKLMGLKSELDVIETQLTTAYEQIGKRYVATAISTGDTSNLDVMDILNTIEPQLDKKSELEKEFIQIEKDLKDQLLMSEKAGAQREFDSGKEKLDKALGMDVMNQGEYDAKIVLLQKKLDNFEEIRRINEQKSMGVIDDAEFKKKMDNLGVN